METQSHGISRDSCTWMKRLVRGEPWTRGVPTGKGSRLPGGSAWRGAWSRSLDVQGRADGAAERVLAADLPAGAEAVLVTQLELAIGLSYLILSP